MLSGDRGDLSLQPRRPMADDGQRPPGHPLMVGRHPGWFTASEADHRGDCPINRKVGSKGERIGWIGRVLVFENF